MGLAEPSRADAASVPTDVAVSIKGVSHAYGDVRNGSLVETLDDVTLDVRRGELLALIGPSGCGKSTLLNIIGGLVEAGTGSVSVNGKPVRGPTPDQIAFVFQENTLFPWNSVVENIMVALEFQGVPRTERKDRADDALAMVGLLDFAGHYPHQLSGGMKQRASLARALSLHTDILLMDEPFAALDEQTRMYLGEELSGLLSRTNKTIIFVTHSLAEAVFLADRVVAMTARPAAIKSVIEVPESHPRDPEFMTSQQFTNWRNELYSLLREEIQKTVGGLNGGINSPRTASSETEAKSSRLRDGADA